MQKVPSWPLNKNKFICLGLYRHWGTAEQWERESRGFAGVRTRGSRLRHPLPAATLDFAMNHCDQPDVAMFDFTSMYASESAALVRERFGHSVLVALVGDSLLEVRRIHYCVVILK